MRQEVYLLAPSFFLFQLGISIFFRQKITQTEIDVSFLVIGAVKNVLVTPDLHNHHHGKLYYLILN